MFVLLFLLKKKHNLNKTHLKKFMFPFSHKFLHAKIVTFCGNVSVFSTFNCGFDSIRIVEWDE